VTPLKVLTILDIKHVDLEPLTEVEKNRKVGPNRDNRRIATKFLSHMRFLCCFLTTVLTKLEKIEEVITLLSVDQMFEVLAHLIMEKDRASQKNWTSTVRELRRKEFAEKIES
jgi:hypothetical protein